MNGHDDTAVDAALLSKALGKPVRVQWTREDEHGWDPKGPPQLVDLRAGVDERGGVLAWETQAWLPAATAGLPNILLLAPEAAKDGWTRIRVQAGGSGRVITTDARTGSFECYNVHVAHRRPPHMWIKFQGVEGGQAPRRSFGSSSDSHPFPAGDPAPDTVQPAD
jgi:hypothetical protein